MKQWLTTVVLIKMDFNYLFIPFIYPQVMFRLLQNMSHRRVVIVRQHDYMNGGGRGGGGVSGLVSNYKNEHICFLVIKNTKTSRYEIKLIIIV